MVSLNLAICMRLSQDNRTCYNVKDISNLSCNGKRILNMFTIFTTGLRRDQFCRRMLQNLTMIIASRFFLDFSLSSACRTTGLQRMWKLLYCCSCGIEACLCAAVMVRSVCVTAEAARVCPYYCCDAAAGAMMGSVCVTVAIAMLGLSMLLLQQQCWSMFMLLLGLSISLLQQQCWCMFMLLLGLSISLLQQQCWCMFMLLLGLSISLLQQQCWCLCYCWVCLYHCCSSSVGVCWCYC